MGLKAALNAILHEQGNLYFIKQAYYAATAKKIKDYRSIKSLFEGKRGLEIGGPSGMFKDAGAVPIYRVIKGLDGCNFSTNTLWEGSIASGNTYKYYRNNIGTQFISEATDLHMLENECYDFLISSNCLEHIANPLIAVQEWLRVIKKGGLILLALPNKIHNFDHNRPVTSFEHLLQDYNSNIGEDDLTHLDEIMQLHDLSMDLPAGTPGQFRERSLKNLENRALHHHVFDTDLLRDIFSHFGVETLLTEVGVDHIIVGRKN